MSRAHLRKDEIAFDSFREMATAVFVVATVLIYWTDVLRLLFPGDAGGASAAFRLTHFAIYGVVIMLLIGQVARLKQLLASAPTLIVLLCLPIVSSLWSIDTQETTQRSIAVFGSSLFGIYLATEVSHLRTIKLLTIAVTLAALLSLCLIALVPSVGITQTEEYFGTWKGAYSHKNGFGQMTALGAVLCALTARFAKDNMRRIALTGFVLNLVLLAGSRSLTAQMLFVFCFLTLLCAGRIVRFVADQPGLAFVTSAVLLTLAFIAFSADDAAGLLLVFGKDANLSARWPMWQALVPFIEQKFWLGYGYEAFWTDTNYAVSIVAKQLKFRPHYGHNGIIELMLGLGAVGTVLFLFVFGAFLCRSLALLSGAPQHPVYLFAVIFAFAMIIHNTSESTMLQRNAMTWNLFVMLAAMVALDRCGSSVVRPMPLAVNSPPSRPGQLSSQDEHGLIPQRLSVV
jgi:exopolysaccharide production protein ExoQ